MVLPVPEGQNEARNSDLFERSEFFEFAECVHFGW
jgi:hypothetical protein